MSSLCKRASFKRNLFRICKKVSWLKLVGEESFPSGQEPPHFSGLTATGKHLRGLTAVSLTHVQKLIVYRRGMYLTT